MIVRVSPPATPADAPRPEPALPLPAPLARHVAPWRVVLALGLPVLGFLLRGLGWAPVIVLGWIAAMEWVAIVREMAGASRAVHESGPPEVRP